MRKYSTYLGRKRYPLDRDHFTQAPTSNPLFWLYGLVSTRNMKDSTDTGPRNDDYPAYSLYVYA